jgi:TnpA family transposase
MLTRGESVHESKRAIYAGEIAPDHGWRRDEMIAKSGSLTLLTNIAVAWNTQRMQATLDGWRSKGQGLVKSARGGVHRRTSRP